MVSQSVAVEAGHSPLITIAIPTFNRASWLRGCVQAALAQSYAHLEVVVSDNASTDETSAVLGEFEDRRLRVLKQSRNVGLTANWNACLTAAEGEYIVFVPDDDRIAPWFLERCIALIRRDPQISVVVALSGIHFVDEARMEWAPANPKLGTGIWDGADILNEYLCGRIFAFHACTTLIRTKALRSRGGFPVGWPHTGDLAGWLPCLLSGSAGFVNENCGHSSAHGTTATAGFGLEIFLKDLEKIVDLIIDVIGNSRTTDPKMRRRIERNARRWLAISMIHLFASRRRDSRLADVLPLMWRWRRQLSHVDMFHALKLTRLVALTVLPSPAVRRFREIKLSLEAVARFLR
jgi:glycosyltransferase involved in cell wall biosynthesis